MAEPMPKILPGARNRWERMYPGHPRVDVIVRQVLYETSDRDRWAVVASDGRTVTIRAVLDGGPLHGRGSILRSAGACTTVQPNDESLVFFHLGEDDRPVSIELLGRLPASSLLRALGKFMERRNGNLTPGDYARIAWGMSEAQAKLEAVA